MGAREGKLGERQDLIELEMRLDSWMRNKPRGETGAQKHL